MSTALRTSLSDQLESIVRSEWLRLHLSGDEPDDLSFVFDTSNSSTRDEVDYIDLRDRSSRPLFAGKVAREGRAGARLVREQSMLRELVSLAPRISGVAFPRPLFARTQDGFVFTGESKVAGVALDLWADRFDEAHRAEAAFGRVASWFTEFWNETGFLQGSSGALWEPLTRALHFCMETLPWSPREERELESVIEEIENRRDDTELYVFGHGATRTEMFSVAGKRTCVSDWSEARTRSFAWADPLLFLLDAAMDQPAATAEDSLMGLWIEDGWNLEARKFLQKCFEEGAVAPEILSVALPAILAEKVRRSSIRDRREPGDDALWQELLRVALRPSFRRELLATALLP